MKRNYSKCKEPIKTPAGSAQTSIPPDTLQVPVSSSSRRKDLQVWKAKYELVRAYSSLQVRSENKGNSGQKNWAEHESVCRCWQST